MKNEPNKITATLKVIVTGEFYDDEASEETLRYCVEQDLEDAGFDVNVELLKEQSEIVLCKDCKNAVVYDGNEVICTQIDSNGNDKHSIDWFCADGERKEGR